MSLVSCAECGHSVSSSARICPSCGTPAKRMLAGQPKRMSIWLKLLIGFVGLGVLGSTIQALVPVAPKSQADLEQKKAADHRVKMAMLAAQSVKDGLNDPSSAAFDKILVNEDGTLVCMRYRAKNRFGALVMGQTVTSDGAVLTAASAWRKNCAKAMLYDLTDVSAYLR